MNDTDKTTPEAVAPDGRFPSLFLPILESRSWPAAILLFATLQAMLTLFGLPSWSCPIFKVTGMQCPGCGMSRAMACLFKADWQASWHYHPFAGIYALGALLLLVLIGLPTASRKRWVTALRRIDRRYGFTLVFLSIQILWGLWRSIGSLAGN